MKTAKITHVTGNGHYDSNYGRLYKFEYTFDDGVTLSANHKTENCPFKNGDEVEYEIKGSNDYGSYGKVSKPSEQPNSFQAKKSDPNVQRYIVKQSSLERAMEYMTHHKSEFSKDDVLALADEFAEWVLSDKKAFSTQQQNAMHGQAHENKVAQTISQDSGDLPF